MTDQHRSTPCADDDLAFLDGLLTTAAAKPVVPSRPLRPATLRSHRHLRREALAGYRFRTRLDYLLLRCERLLVVGVLAFFSWWLYDGYGRDLIYAMQHPAQPRADLQQVTPGASAAELSRYLGQTLPFETAGMQLPAAPPDYLIPAQGFLLPVAPTPTPQPADQRPVRLLVPAMNLDTPVYEVFLVDGAWQVAEYAAGYHHGTAFPGQGNTVLAGHAGLRGAVFGRLHVLAPGDDLYLDAGTTRYHYRVRLSHNVLPHQVEVMYPTSEPILTLITCTAWDTQRLVVVADLIDTAPLPPGEGANGAKGETAP